ncbi:MAG: hypothetical protein L0I76_22480 [Pseudonocardia sp.]|nr:hypothetical protein [Pseudonocardia sp.]
MSKKNSSDRVRTWIGSNTGAIHTGDGDVVVDGKQVTDDSTYGKTVEVREDGTVYVDGKRRT